MKAGLRYGLIGVAALGAALAALPFVVPADIYKDRIEQSLDRATGRDFTIAGPLHFTLFPALGLRAERISLSNPPGFRSPTLAAADDLRMGVRFWPLFSGRLEVDRIVLDRPKIALEVDAKGRGDWVLARAAATAPPGNGKPRTAFAVHVSSLEIVQGRVTYANVRTGTTRTIDGVDAKVAFGAFDAPAVMDGSFAFKERRVDLHAKISTLRSLFQDRTTGFDLSLKSDVLQAAFAGTVAPDGNASGRLTLDTTQLRSAGDWLGVKLPTAGGFERLSLSAELAGDNKHAQLSALNAALDGAAIAGDVKLDTSGAVPDVEGALRIDRLDLDPYIAPPPNHGPPPPPRPKTREDGWSRDPIALDALRRIDARLTLAVGSLSVKHLKLGKASIAVGLAGGRLSAALDPVSLYGGRGKALLVVTAGPVPRFVNTLEFDDVALQPFFSDTIGVGQIAGTGTIRLDVTAQGNTPDAVMHALNGTGAIAFRDGRLRGVDLGATAHAIQAMLGATEGKGAFTDYSAMSGSFAVAKGVLTSKDFALQGRLIRMTGAGNVDVAGRAIDFKVVPTATAQIAKIKLTVGVPFHIVGPWRHVRYKADLLGAANAFLDNLLGHKKPDPNAPKKKHKSVGEALKNMLGIH